MVIRGKLMKMQPSYSDGKELNIILIIQVQLKMRQVSSLFVD